MGSKKKNIYGPQKTKNNKLIYKKIGPNITGIQKEWIDKIVALDIVPVTTIKNAFKIKSLERHWKSSPKGCETSSK